MRCIGAKGANKQDNTFIFEARTRSIWKITKSEKISSSLLEMNNSQFRSK